MAYTPWRVALDAKVRLIGYLHTDAFQQSHADVGLDSTPHMRGLQAYHLALIHAAEPIWVAPNVHRGIVNNLCDESTVFDMHSLRIPKEGLVWFGEPLRVPIVGRHGTHEEYTGLKGVQYGIDDVAGTLQLVMCGWQDVSGSVAPVVINAVEDDQTIEEWILNKAINFEESPMPPPHILARLDALGVSVDAIRKIDSIDVARSLYGLVLRYMYTLFSFMDQRIVTSPPTAVDRNATRQAARATPPVHPEVRVITWRLKKYEKLETTTRQVDWSCRWPSRAHDRHLADGRVIPIPASIKGPPDKPLKAATPNVHQVTRK